MNFDRVYAVVYYEPANGKFGVDEEATLDYFRYGQFHSISRDRFEPVSEELAKDLKGTVGSLILLPEEEKEETK